MPDAEIERELPGRPEVVFDHLTVADLLVTWWPTHAETDPRPGGSYRLHWDGPDVTLRGTYEIVDRPDHLRYTWSWDHDDDHSTVDIALSAAGVGTAIRIHQTASTAEERDGYLAGWSHFLDKLATNLRG